MYSIRKVIDPLQIGLRIFATAKGWKSKKINYTEN